MPRFLARLIDGLLLGFLMFVIIVPIVFVGIFGTSGYSAFTGIGISSILISVVFAAIVIGYFAYMESSRGQTVGKMVMKLKTVGPDGKNPTFVEAAKR
ncbi:MAG: RDD family protein, partial [Acidimicrobiia bacterium]